MPASTSAWHASGGLMAPSTLKRSKTLFSSAKTRTSMTSSSPTSMLGSLLGMALGMSSLSARTPCFSSHPTRSLSAPDASRLGLVGSSDAAWTTSTSTPAKRAEYCVTNSPNSTRAFESFTSVSHLLTAAESTGSFINTSNCSSCTPLINPSRLGSNLSNTALSFATSLMRWDSRARIYSSRLSRVCSFALAAALVRR